MDRSVMMPRSSWATASRIWITNPPIANGGIQWLSQRTNQSTCGFDLVKDRQQILH
jgi:hypothetical protein